MDILSAAVYICIQIYNLAGEPAGKETAMLELSSKTNLLEENDYRYSLQDVKDPVLYRDVYNYDEVPKVAFNHRRVPMSMPADIWITDTSFRDGQQSMNPYTPEQIEHLFKLLSKLGGPYGLIRQTEFFIYSKRDREAIERCQALGLRFPEITTWIRATREDFRMVKDLGIKETGILVSCSDYHIFKKMQMTRRQALDYYLATVKDAFDAGVMPRCHLEDITRADFYGFVVPFVNELMELSREAGIPVRIRASDTMGYGVPFPGAALPRSVQRIVRAFTDEAGVPGAWLEWHGHNDFHKVLVNGVTAWLYGCGGVNGTLMGFGERTGNAPLEALVIDYISLTGNDEAADPTVITEIAQYFEKELDYRIPDNYPFAGKDFNATSAGIHVDGLAKNEEIYNIFDTTKILNRSVPIIINDKAGRAGVAYWINQQFNLPPERQVSKKHPAVGQIHTRIMAAYEEGRNTSFSNKEIKNLVRRFMPELFDSEFDQMKRIAGELASNLVERLARDCQSTADSEALTAQLQHFVRDYSFIQYAYVTDVKGHSTAIAISDPGDQKGYKAFPIGFDYSNREWFLQPMRTGKLHITNVHQSQVTGQLIITVSTVITDANDEIIGVLGADIQLEEIIRRAESLEAEVPNSEEE